MTLAAPPTEDQLGAWLADIASGDARALRRLYDATSPKLFALALRITGNREWAEDVMQDTYLQVWRHAADYQRSLSPPMAWLGLLTRSRALDFLRRRGSERLDRAVEIDEALADTLADDHAPDPQAMALASQQAWALHQCLQRLEGRQRSVVSLAYLHDLSHSELATQLSLPIGTVKTWIRRGLIQLRDCMTRFA